MAKSNFKPDFKKIDQRITTWENRGKAGKTLYTMDERRGQIINGIYCEDCSSFVSALVLGDDGSRSYTGEMVGWQNGEQHEQKSLLASSWGFKKVKQNPDLNFSFKKFDIVVASKKNSDSVDADAHTAMIIENGKGNQARLIHGTSRPYPGATTQNFFGTWNTEYNDRIISVWRATHGIFIYDAKPLKNNKNKEGEKK